VEVLTMIEGGMDYDAYVGAHYNIIKLYFAGEEEQAGNDEVKDSSEY
jgi:hypothetical protein